MIIWIDAQLSPALAPWLTGEFGVKAIAIRDLDLRHAQDPRIFEAARQANAVVLTKDADFPLLLARLGAPPAVIWVRCGNTSNDHLMKLLRATFPKVLAMLEAGETLVEIADLP